jgi:hypothetical protein
LGVEGVNFECGGGGGESEDGEAVEGGELWEPPDGVDVMGLWESVDLWTPWEGGACNGHWFRVLEGVCVLGGVVGLKCLKEVGLVGNEKSLNGF